MNGIEKITERIRRDAQSEIDALLLEAGKKADGIRAEAELRVEQRLSIGRRQNAEAAANHESRLVSAAEMEARQKQLAAKQEALEEVFSLAQQKLLNLPEEQFVEMLAAFAAREGESGEEELLFSPEARERIGEKVVARANALREGAAYTLSRETRETDGVILRRGKMEHNGSIAIAMRERKQRMAAEIAEMLFA